MQCKISQGHYEYNVAMATYDLQIYGACNPINENEYLATLNLSVL